MSLPVILRPEAEADVEDISLVGIAGRPWRASG